MVPGQQVPTSKTYPFEKLQLGGIKYLPQVRIY
jgi:hypothetical protein